MILVHNRDQNIFRAKEEILRGMYDEMRMKEGENSVQYVNWVKEAVSAIKFIGGFISNQVVSKILRKKFHVYAIIVSTI